MKLYGGRFRSRKSMKRALGMSGDSGGHSGYYLNPVQVDGSGNRFVEVMSKAGRAMKHKLSSGRGR